MSNASDAAITHTIEGVTYSFRPLNLEDIEWLELWLKSRVIEAGSAAADMLPKHKGDRVLRMAALEAAEIDIMSGDFAKLLSVSGVSRMMYRMVIKDHPEVTVEQCRGWITDEKISKALTAKINVLQPGGSAASEEDAAASGAPLREPRLAGKKRGRGRNSTARK